MHTHPKYCKLVAIIKPLLRLRPIFRDAPVGRPSSQDEGRTRSGSRRLLENLPADQQAPDLARAGADGPLLRNAPIKAAS
jgi:hypothetical protein